MDFVCQWCQVYVEIVGDFDSFFFCVWYFVEIIFVWVIIEVNMQGLFVIIVLDGEVDVFVCGDIVDLVSQIVGVFNFIFFNFKDDIFVFEIVFIGWFVSDNGVDDCIGVVFDIYGGGNVFGYILDLYIQLVMRYMIIFLKLVDNV